MTESANQLTARVFDPDSRRGPRLAAILNRNHFDAVWCRDAAAATDGGPGCDLFVIAGSAEGMALCRELSAHSEAAVPYILVVTEGPEDKNRLAAIEAGATELLTGPISWPAMEHLARRLARTVYNERLRVDANVRNSAFLNAIPDTIVRANRNGQSVVQLSGDPKRPFSFERFPERLVRRWKRDIVQVIDTDSVRSNEFSDGSGDQRRNYEMRIVRYTDDEALMIVRDTTSQKQANAKVLRLAFYDTLTGLPNRQSFMTRVNESIRDAQQSNGRFSILYLDLDNFKRINDSMGHTVGDDLLKSVAERIESCVRSDDVIARNSSLSQSTDCHTARLGGDEFTVLLKHIDTPEGAHTVAERISRAVSEPIVYQDREFVFTSSIGVVCYPDDGDDIDTLLANADMAMYRAKDSGKNTVRSFSETMSIRSLEYMDLEHELRQAIAESSLSLHYQPKLSLKNGTITGFEALCRWFHPERGAIPPDKFVHIAVQSGMILELSDWVLNEACRQVAAWQSGKLAGIPVAINLSGQQFAHSDVNQVIRHALHAHSVSPTLLELELTESELMADANRTIVTLNKLKEAGVSIAVDDFGTGYSSLAYLKRFPIDSLKIDRSFGINVEDGNDNFSICSAIIALAHNLGLRVVAEGVESFEHQHQLVMLGCDEMQGYYFARPQPAAELESFVRNYGARGPDRFLRSVRSRQATGSS